MFSSTLALVTDRDPRIGRILKGTYRVRRLLGQGGMGTVYEAGHVFLPTRYAIKFLTGGLNDEDLYRRFVREAEIAARLGSRHAVRIYDFAIDDDRSPEKAAPHVAVSISVTDLPRLGRGDRADIVVAVTESGLRTDVKRGENRGRTLSHAPVVRYLAAIGQIAGDGSTSGAARADIPLAADWQRDHLTVVAFVQELRGRTILASASVPLKNAHP